MSIPRIPSRPRHVLATVVSSILLQLTQAEGQPFLESPPNGFPRNGVERHALVGATVHTSPNETLENATVVIAGDRIEAILQGPADEPASPPPDARVWDYENVHLYAGFIEPFLEVDAPAPDSNRPGAHWNSGITPTRRTLEGASVSESDRAALRDLGFTVAALSPNSGLFRGFGAVVSLGAMPQDRSQSKAPVLATDAFQAMSFSGNGNPNSLMGVIALIRQTFLDASWNQRVPTPPNDLDALDAVQRYVFQTRNELEAFRAQKVFAEFGVDQAILVGSGAEYKRLAALDNQHPFIVPLDFPGTPSLTSFDAQTNVSLRDLMTWDQAPTNPARLVEAGFSIALTSSENRGAFRKSLMTAIERGLSETEALAALTTTPADIYGLSTEIGRIQPGFRANLVAFSKSAFDKKAKTLDVWIDGQRYEQTPKTESDYDGDWTLRMRPQFVEDLGLSVKDGKWTFSSGESSSEATGVYTDDDSVSFVLPNPEFKPDAILSFSARRVADKKGVQLRGHAIDANGTQYRWRASLSEEEPTKDPKDQDPKSDGAEDDARDSWLAGYPFGPYAYESAPEQRNVVFTDAVIWTSGPEGIIENGALWARDGVIQAVGTVDEVIAQVDGADGKVERVNLEGAHLTPGLIDCHSHTGIQGGVNEVRQIVTAEVDVGMVTDPDDINWYRQIAGGLTTVNTLHGSANPIGGQNQVNKLRWGCVTPDEMHLKGSIEGIKFALGENVKRSTSRYPNTRMGVDAVFRERFDAAAAYHRAWSAFRGGEGPEPRRDLELDALSEILSGERLIHCHSYRQDEILALCRVAEDYNFRIGTFQHILEGYKVAEFVRDFSGGGSAFADWWAYKVEVQDAIPFAGAIMREVGVTVSFNSDSSELARRMNLEAAKAVKYGGVPPAEALKFVTLNPAKQLQIDGRVGSLEAGKDADLAIWSGSPLSTFSKCLATWIDGREYYSVERDRDLRERNRKERARLISKALERPVKTDDKDADAEESPAESAAPEIQTLAVESLMMRRYGLDPSQHQCGECGMRSGSPLPATFNQ